MIISACNDEISTALAPALDVLESQGIRHVDLRGVGSKTWQRNVFSMSDEEATQAQQLIQARGFKVSALSTPVGKTHITDDFAAEVARFSRALELAQLFGAPYLRVFSFYASDEEAMTYRTEALRRLRTLCEMAQKHNIVVAHENEEGGFCAWRPDECLAFHQELPENFRAVFEPCSFAVVGYDPYTEALPLLQPYIAYVHVRDTKRGTTQYSVVGEGDVRWVEILSDLQADGFQGYLTLEPHLRWESYEKVTDDHRATYFRRAAQALRAALALAEQ